MNIIGIVGWSGAGKTTLVKKLLPALLRSGLSVSTLKHAHHTFDVDVPGKDSHTHRLAGASEVLVASAKRFALMRELVDEPEWTLQRLLSRLAPVDLVLIEGFKREQHPKIEVYRSGNGKPLLYPGDPMVRAVASDVALSDARCPVLQLDDVEAIAAAAIRFATPVEQFVNGKR